MIYFFLLQIKTVFLKKKISSEYVVSFITKIQFHIKSERTNSDMKLEQIILYVKGAAAFDRNAGGSTQTTLIAWLMPIYWHLGLILM
jgi:hypothetical protein